MQIPFLQDIPEEKRDRILRNIYASMEFAFFDVFLKTREAYLIALYCKEFYPNKTWILEYNLKGVFTGYKEYVFNSPKNNTQAMSFKDRCKDINKIDLSKLHTGAYWEY